MNKGFIIIHLDLFMCRSLIFAAEEVKVFNSLVVGRMLSTYQNKEVKTVMYKQKYERPNT